MKKLIIAVGITAVALMGFDLLAFTLAPNRARAGTPANPPGISRSAPFVGAWEGLQGEGTIWLDADGTGTVRQMRAEQSDISSFDFWSSANARCPWPNPMVWKTPGLVRTTRLQWRKDGDHLIIQPENASIGRPKWSVSDDGGVLTLDRDPAGYIIILQRVADRSDKKAREKAAAESDAIDRADRERIAQERQQQERERVAEEARRLPEQIKAREEYEKDRQAQAAWLKQSNEKVDAQLRELDEYARQQNERVARTQPAIEREQRRQMQQLEEMSRQVDAQAGRPH